MAKDRAGFEQGRRRDDQGRPLKLMTPPAGDAYRDGWERTFGKKPSPVTKEMVEAAERAEDEFLERENKRKFPNGWETNHG